MSIGISFGVFDNNFTPIAFYVFEAILISYFPHNWHMVVKTSWTVKIAGYLNNSFN